MDPNIRLRINIWHKAPVSMAVVTESISIINNATLRASQEVLDEILGRQPDDLRHWSAIDIAARQLARERLRELARERMKELAPDALWLDDVESGSSKFKGIIGPLILGGLGAIAGKTVADSMDKSDLYGQVTESIGTSIDETIHHVGSRIKDIIEEANRGESNETCTKFEVTFLDGTMTVDIYPSRMQMSFRNFF